MTSPRQPLCILALLALVTSGGCTQQEQPVQPGNKVVIDFTCRLANGSLVETTRGSLAGDETVAKSPIFRLRDSYRPYALPVPEPSKPLPMSPIDQLEKKIAKALANLAATLPPGQTNTVPLASEEIKDFPTHERFLPMATHYTLPRTRGITMEEFEARYGNTPRTLGSKVGEDSNYPGVVRGADGTKITIYYSVQPGVTVPSIVGPMPIRELDADNFEVNIKAEPGQLVQQVGGLPGRISSVEKDHFTIDFGQTFAGETLTCEVIVQPLKPEQEGKPSPALWIEDYQQGLSQARRQNKPVLLLLTGNDCPDCTNMEQTLLLAPSLRDQRDRFILVKINGNQQKQLAERFGRKDYPLTLVLDGLGKELTRMSGKQHIATLASTLEQVLNKGKKG